MGTLSYMSLIGKYQDCKDQLVHCDTANAATNSMTQDAHLNIVHKTRGTKDMKQPAIWFLYIHIMVDSCQLTV